MEDTFHVASIDPVISYCLGGLQIDTHARVIGRDNHPIRGLYAAGEVAGGVHGSTILAGNDLLDCVVFGRTAGVTAATDVYGQDFVDSHMNPEVIKAQLLKAIEEQDRVAAKVSQSLAAVKQEIKDVQAKIATEQTLVAQGCEKIAKSFGSFAPNLGELKFVAGAANADQMLGVPSAKALAGALRVKRKQLEEELEHVKAQMDQFTQNMDSQAKEIVQLKKVAKQQAAEKKKLEAQLEEIRNSSTVIRDIHQLEGLIAGYKERQEKAERTKHEVETEWERKQQQLEAGLVSCHSKTEELEVMSRLEKVERKRQVEQISQLVERMKQRVAHEHAYAVKAAALAAHESFPVFQIPFKRRACPQLGSGAN
jgi:hypothetical protein